jgi:hypothetical protein
MRLAALLLALAASRAQAFGTPDPASVPDQPIAIEAQPIAAFERADPARTRFGKLEWRGGLVLKSASPAFGGLSGLALDADGRRFLAVSDVGFWLTGEIAYHGTLPARISGTRIGALRALNGKPLRSKRDYDAEGVYLVEGTLESGAVLISFERNHRIGRFPVTARGIGTPTAYLPLPPEVKRQSSNRSLESICRIEGGPQKGALVTLSERYPSRSGDHVGWLQPPGAGAGWTAFAIRNLGGFDLTDCAGLADGSLLVLERRFSWASWLEGVKMRLRRFSSAEIVPGSARPAEGEVLLEAGAGHEIDNMEGLAVHRRPTGETVLTLISDDNFNGLLQRTLLLQFTLLDASQTAAKP